MATEFIIIGLLIKKIEFWSDKKGYQFNFQFWGKDNNNVFISKDLVEIKSMGGEDSALEIIKMAVEWAEKSNPSIRYPKELEITYVG